MILRYDSNAFYSIGSIFIVTLIFYLLIDLESNHVKRYLPPTKVATNPSDTLETNGGKHEMETPSKRKKFSSLKELKEAAKVALDTCLCSSKQRSSWFGQQERVVPNYLHLVVSYSDKALSLAEAACIKSFLIHQNPDTFYVHTFDLSLRNLGEQWQALYKDPSLHLDTKLRIVGSRDPAELAILGRDSVSGATAKLYWKFFVLQKYGGLLIDRNILVTKSLDLSSPRCSSPPPPPSGPG